MRETSGCLRLLRHIDKREQIMCTSIVSNRKKTIVGWNLNISLSVGFVTVL